MSNPGRVVKIGASADTSDPEHRTTISDPQTNQSVAAFENVGPLSSQATFFEFRQWGEIASRWVVIANLTVIGNDEVSGTG
ncbi:hypothetical protein FA13DRAFT_1734193 [Coprinellus micaceus]|uniref:Uncharacterized protein n=1 Tax=Coprinellus micaceus TaxID=71717 RepID=A0A4Y7T6N5_COPMI|nr:hypothetical protein FA13DRAFT_1734193 [Coprinellus micaceus]